mgnify:FL=1
MKYGIWNIARPQESEIQGLERAGFSPLTARVLCGRGYVSPEDAKKQLDASAPLCDPLAMKELGAAAALLQKAVADGTKIAVFGDYDVDGITATCLLVECLRSLGADCTAHIPGRLEEGYGLNNTAIRQLAAEGVRLIVTVDCGITALDEAEYCKQLGVTLIVTDHHECKERLPDCAAVVDPHRPDRTYPHTDLSGVGVAFKLASVLLGSQEEAARRWCDLYCLGTIADVMPLRGENRRLVVMGLAAMQHPARLGLRALIEACGCGTQAVTASTIGYVLAPRINAAGRMEHAELAVQLFLSHDPEQAAQLAQTLCRLNRERQSTESVIYREALALLQQQEPGSAIVLAGEGWHQGVVGIVASRLSEEFCRPTFLICLDGDHGKASSRSYGGFNLFAALRELSPLLEGFGGHELAAGFTIRRENIPEFRRRICELAAAYAATGAAVPTLEIDCEVPGRLLTERNVQGLSQLEPCGTGCPKPMLCLTEAIVEQTAAVGGGKHLRLKLRSRDGAALQAIYFSVGSLKLLPGERVDVAFTPQINEFRGARSVQLNLTDLRRVSPCEYYDRFRRHEALLPCEADALMPERADVADVWNYLRANAQEAPLQFDLSAFCAAVASASRERHSVRRTMACLDILAELRFIEVRRSDPVLLIRLLPVSGKNPLENSRLYRALRGESL